MPGFMEMNSWAISECQTCCVRRGSTRRLGDVVLVAAIVAGRGLVGNNGRECCETSHQCQKRSSSQIHLWMGCSASSGWPPVLFIFLKRSSRTTFHPARSGLTNCPSCSRKFCLHRRGYFQPGYLS